MTAAELVPASPTLPRLRDAAAACRACPLWERGTQTVFGEGARTARAMLVGEQPGDQEDGEGAICGSETTRAAAPSSPPSSTTCGVVAAVL